MNEPAQPAMPPAPEPVNQPSQEQPAPVEKAPAQNPPETHKNLLTPAPDQPAPPAEPDQSTAEQSTADKPFQGGDLPDLGLAPEADQTLLTEFGQIAKETGLTPTQMRSLAQWQASLIKQRQEAQVAEGIAELKKEWGQNAEAFQRQAVALIASVDRQMSQYGQSPFSDAIAETGAHNNLNFVRGLFLLSRSLGEDALAAPHSQATANSVEDPADAIAKLFQGK